MNNESQIDRATRLAVSAVKTMVGCLAEQGVMREVAELQWGYMEDLMELGFSREEAFKIVLSTKLPGGGDQK